MSIFFDFSKEILVERNLRALFLYVQVLGCGWSSGNERSTALEVETFNSSVRIYPQINKRKPRSEKLRKVIIRLEMKLSFRAKILRVNEARDVQNNLLKLLLENIQVYNSQ